MMKRIPMGLIAWVGVVLAGPAAGSAERLALEVDGREVAWYQAAPMSEPRGGDAFRVSNFFHPLKTPSGFVVTNMQPGDHLHHTGLWWPWKYVRVGGRQVNCWELQHGEGLVEARESRRTEDGLTARSVYIDRRAPGGPSLLLHETLNVTVSDLVEAPTCQGYYLDLEISHEVAGEEPLTIATHHYSGFAIRGAPSWNRDNSAVLTSEGRDYSQSNATRARWVKVEGAAEEGRTAGFILMSRPDNHAHPEHLRTWNPDTHHGSIFINFNPVQAEPWRFEPGRAYVRNYRVFVYDGSVSAEGAEALWRQYQETAAP